MKLFASGSMRWCKSVATDGARVSAFVAILFFVPAAFATDASLTPMIDVVEAPDPELHALDGEPYVVSQWRGQVVVVNFWATWCAPCIKELPSLQALYDHFKDEGVRVVAINPMEDVDQIESYLRDWQTPPTMDFVIDRTREASLRDWRVRVFPTTYVIDKTGKVAFRAQGERDFSSAAILDEIASLL